MLENEAERFRRRGGGLVMLDLSRFDWLTPGRLAVDSTPSDGATVYHVESGLMVADFRDSEIRGVLVYAELFAAAPDLLSELREARAEIERLRNALQKSIAWHGCTEECLYRRSEGNVHSDFCTSARAALSGGGK